ncbi:hypothetical protein HH303_09375 [Rhodospirillaceae bacterium KN72]|uniref:C4-dicarboxylate ABC transporter n=1 Tax=Pacificispira spongiicola TaxID=2729598 RepID=A0A7Y0HEB9_9PROT|nr:SLAC1 anion channel family protein [Pacificispira spongiicola]NMM44691.1 hypothetical protein [Pacificispira spongiicola]
MNDFKVQDGERDQMAQDDQDDSVMKADLPVDAPVKSETGGTEATETAAKKSAKKASRKKAAAKKASSKKAAAAPAEQAKPADSGPAPADTGPVPASLQHMPVTLFGAGLGLAGFATAWREIAAVFGWGILLSKLLVGIALGVFGILVILYGIKTLRHFPAVKAEFRHPVTSNFFSAATMTLMILASHLGQAAPMLAEGIWVVAAVINVAISVIIVTFWIGRDCHISHVAPVWFIPVVGNLVIPIVGAPMGYTQLGWMIFAIGLLFWLVLFTVILYRLIFERPLENPQRPSLFILIAPPSLCFVSYVVLKGGLVDGVASMFLGVSIFMLLILLPQIPALMRLPFGISWWSYTFPLAVFSVACTLYADAINHAAASALSVAAIAGVSMITLLVSVQTIRFVMAGRILRPVETPLPKP